MSSSDNYGTQRVSIDFKLPLKGSYFTEQLYSIIKPGVYKGIDVSIAQNNINGHQVDITRGQAFLNCIFEGETRRSIKVEFQSNINAYDIPQSASGLNEIIYLSYEYKELTENWVEILHIAASGTLPDNAVVIAECGYDGSGNIIDISYSNRQYGLFNSGDNYSLVDTNIFSNDLNETKKFRFSASGITPSGVSGASEVRVITIPDHDYLLNTINDWQVGINYKEKEVILFNKTLYRCLIEHTSNDFFSDLNLLYWENMTAVAEEEIVLGYNDTGSTLLSGKVIKVSGDFPSEKIPEVSLINDYLDEPFGVVIDNILTSNSGELIQRGRIELSSYDFSSGSVGQKIYCDNTGSLTLSVTPLIIGQLLDPVNSIIYVSILPAEEGLDVTNFNGQLSVNENSIQKAFDRIDDFGYLPIWVTNKSYRVGNSITKNGIIYTCLIAHTSNTFSTDLIANRWLKVQSYLDVSNLNGQLSSGVETTYQQVIDRLDDYGYIPSWQSGLNYRIGNSFIYNNIIYSVIGNYTSSGSFATDLASGNIVELINSQLVLSNIKTDSTSGIINSLNVTGTSIIRLTNASTLNGILNPNSVKIITISNLTGSDITISNNSASALIGNKILTGLGLDVVLLNEVSMSLFYDTTSGYWRVIGKFDSTETNPLSTYIVRKSTTIASGGSTATIVDIFTSQIAGTYRFKDQNNNQIWGNIYFQSITDYDLVCNEVNVSDVQGDTGTLNIYAASGNLTFENRTSNSINLVIYREV